MYKLQIYVQCHNKFLEVLPDEIESAELAVEDAVSRVVLDLFDEGIVAVDHVTIHFSPDLPAGPQHYSIQIHAQYSYESTVSLPCTKEDIEHIVEESIRPILKELFGSVKVESVTFNSLHGKEE